MNPGPAAADIGLVRRGFSATGGAEAYLMRLGAGLRARGYAPTLYTTPEWPDDRWPYGEIIRLYGRSPKKFAAAFQMARRPDQVVLGIDRVPGCDVFRAGDGVHAAWLYRRSAFEPAWKRFFHLINPKHLSLIRLECEVVQNARCVIVNSNMVAGEMARWHELSPERIRLVRNGLGDPLPSLPSAEAREKLGLPPDAFCVLFVGTGWDRKGLRFAIRAVESIGGNAILLVAGRGPAERFASPMARFLGPVRDLAPLFSAADVFTLPTIYDPFSNASLEALAAGLPVVTTTANGCSEIIQPGVHGQAVAPGDVPALAEAIASWRDRPRDRVAAACRALAAQYPIRRNVEETLEILTAAAAL